MPTLTIFTPTFNRKHTLIRLYNSLVNQTCYDFEWLIVDDGSTDDTKSLIESFDTKKFKIRYIYQKNSGKHIATNLGLKKANGNLFTCLDSDDWFYYNAVETIISKFKKDNNIKGLILLDSYEDGSVIGDFLPEIENLNWVDLRYKYKINGDKCYVFKTSIVRYMTFPQFENSKHMPPSYQLFEFSRLYKFQLANVKVKYVEYQVDGISSKVKLNYFVSAGNYCEYRKFAHDQLPNFKEKLKNILLYDISWISLRLKVKYRFNDKRLFISTVACLPVAYSMYIYYKINFWKKGIM
ncbi:glycosyltransferase family 2 protein [Staphylococcus cohnii]|uniref:glycosyltransferase family 2 protein n=1 Tax=Staphylococcus cohnii TaxID=29382 RepID=UPI00374E7475